MEVGNKGKAHNSIAGSIGVIILGAGKSQRMDSIDKILMPILGTPLIVHTLKQFDTHEYINKIVLVLSSENIDNGRRLLANYNWNVPIDICQGGHRRQDSVKAGLDLLNHHEWIMIHDGARPMVEHGVISRAVESTKTTMAAIAAVPATDTMKSVSEDGSIITTVPREKVWMVQTPQIFSYDLLSEAHRKCHKTYSDDSSMVETLGYTPKIFMGSRYNIKVTTIEDLSLIESIFKNNMPESSTL